MNKKEYFDKLIISGNIQKTLEEVLIYSKSNNNDLYKNALLLLARWNRNEDKLRKAIISDRDYNLEANKIIFSLQEYLGKDKNLTL